jgi:hypothetical protein
MLGTRIRYPKQQLLSSPKTFKIRKKKTHFLYQLIIYTAHFFAGGIYTAVTLGLHNEHLIAPSYTLIGRDGAIKETFLKSIVNLKKSLLPKIIPLQYLRKLGYDFDSWPLCGLAH